MIYTDVMANIENRIADAIALMTGQKVLVTLGIQEKTITVTIPIKANENDGNANVIINTTKKVLVTGIDKGSLDAYSVGNSNGNFIENANGDIAIPFVVSENKSISVYGHVNTAPSSDTDYTVTIKYIELTVTPITS